MSHCFAHKNWPPDNFYFAQPSHRLLTQSVVVVAGDIAEAVVAKVAVDSSVRIGQEHEEREAGISVRCPAGE